MDLRWMLWCFAKKMLTERQFWCPSHSRHGGSGELSSQRAEKVYKEANSLELLSVPHAMNHRL